MFSDRATWQAAVVGVPFAENFEIFDGATLLGSQALPGGSGAFLG